ncbi:hypothetical protein QR680_013561 [Steinernema hermaphroditum]|uniref:Peptidase S1 domain-containing protein n=1 Tax=Steinernema hermaphroditum TaxID=289476 RepID=A0AA39I5Y8_9BILA|nr:hypothetical protein QR680_013561 [Steinernema hermaphroditum]
MCLLYLLLVALSGLASTTPMKPEFPPIDSSHFIQEPSEHPATHEEFMQLLNKTELVFGGQFARPGNFPYQVFINYKKTDGRFYICGGSLVSSTHVLTAAHCTTGMIAPARIMVGAVDIRQQAAPAQWRNIHGVYPHPSYRDGDQSFLNDIAMLEISPPVQVGGVVGLTRIAANDQQLLTGGQAIISGFGTYAFYGNNPVTSEQLRYAQLQVYNSQYCYQQWARFTGGRTRVTTTQICAGGRGRGSGPGDSGGPLSVNTRNGLYQIGLVSFGPTDPNIMASQQDQVPAVFTRVASHCNFIQHYSRNTARCQ